MAIMPSGEIEAGVEISGKGAELLKARVSKA
jgi:hypothetical protein